MYLYRLDEDQEAHFQTEGYELHEMYLDFYYGYKEEKNYGNP